MIVVVNMTEEQSFEVKWWWANSPDFVLATLQRQLEAAAAVWPELKNYSVGVLQRDCSKEL